MTTVRREGGAAPAMDTQFVYLSPHVKIPRSYWDPAALPLTPHSPASARFQGASVPELCSSFAWTSAADNALVS